ncbi:MAG: hypothetical protein IPG93_23985 [Burkholderiales bacterium]|nr:hypothetical protein [Burkholderiales bacterium]
MHLFIPHASALGQAAEAAIRQIDLPHLAELLSALELAPDAAPPAPSQPSTTASHASDEGAGNKPAGDHDELEYRLSPPHEAALARLAGWPGRDGNWPLAAWWARRDGLELSDLASPDAGLGLITPVHWRIGQEIDLTDPQQLELREDESRALLDLVRPSFDDAGWQIHWAAPLRWYASSPALRTLACASIDRVINRNVDLWLPRAADARLLRRLQVEVQMTWHDHPINEAREGRRLPVVNSFWLSGCGVAQAAPLPADLVLDERLAAPLLSGDWLEWCQAWQALDVGPITDLLARARAGQAIELTLCGERLANTWRTPQQARSLWQRTQHKLGGWFGASSAPDVRALLGRL